LQRRVMPLIRYEIGDRAMSIGYASDCRCGLSWPGIGPVEGRSEDLVRTQDGRCVGMLGYSVLRGLVGVQEAQLVQLGFSEFKCLIVRSMNEPGIQGANETHVRNELGRRLSAAVNVTFSYVDCIPRDANGKFKAVKVRMCGSPRRSL
jgi:phenylacetate-CoA ligase